MFENVLLMENAAERTIRGKHQISLPSKLENLLFLLYLTWQEVYSSSFYRAQHNILATAAGTINADSVLKKYIPVFDRFDLLERYFSVRISFVTVTNRSSVSSSPQITIFQYCLCCHVSISRRIYLQSHYEH